MGALLTLLHAGADVPPAHVGQLSRDGRFRWDGVQWLPVVSNPPPVWATPRIRSSASAAALGSALLIGLVTDQWLRTGAFGIGASLTFVLGALVVVWIGGLERFESRALVARAAVFACWFTLRASPWLPAPDLLV